MDVAIAVERVGPLSQEIRERPFAEIRAAREDDVPVMTYGLFFTVAGLWCRQVIVIAILGIVILIFASMN